LKSLGYFISGISVLLLGYVSWQGAKSDPTLQVLLLLGMVASLLGMLLRWLTYREKKQPPKDDAGQSSKEPRPAG
jgi:F0F1-type ATP synthase assembly protein I